jgi:hypothetical protein
MQQVRKKWRADRGDRAQVIVSKISRSIAGLDDEDLLDLHDIFRNAEGTPIMTMAEAEIAERGLSIDGQSECLSEG